MSRSFLSSDLENWKGKLSEVHRYAWDTWAIHLKEKKMYSLASDDIPVAGNIPDEVVEAVKGRIATLPPPKKYHKK